MEAIKVIFVSLICSLLAACANPSIVHVKSQQLESVSQSVIYIPRFEGNPNFVEESTDYFVSLLDPEIKFVPR